jgi:hypothetical protein
MKEVQAPAITSNGASAEEAKLKEMLSAAEMERDKFKGISRELKRQRDDDKERLRALQDELTKLKQ